MFENLATARKIQINQQANLGLEYLVNMGGNKYEIRDDKESPLGYATQESVYSFSWVPFSLMNTFEYNMRIFDLAGKPLFETHSPTCWFLYWKRRLTVQLSNGRPLGYIQRRFSLINRRFDLYDENGRIFGKIVAPIWAPWTFPVYQRGRKLATIAKLWSGLLKETFTKADHFSVTYHSASIKPELKSVLIAGALFIDLTYFEKKADRRNRYR